MKVIGYIRVSTEEQARSGLGMEAQESKIRGYCSLYDLELVDIIVDQGVSGKTLNRPGLSRVIQAVENGDVQGVVVAKLDRLTRNVSDLGTLMQGIFQQADFFSVGEQVDTRTAAGRLVLNVLVSVAQWERETIVERTTDALAAKKARGEKTGGSVPFGFDEVDGKLVENTAEQEIISMIKRLHCAGMSYNGIAARLNKEGIGTKTGKKWAAMQVSRIVKAA